MEVVKYDRLVADFEALECLRKRHQDQKVTGSKKDPSYDSNQPRATELAAEQYLEATPAAQQTRESVSACWRALSEHPHFCNLTAPEKLQVINHRPLQPVAVHLMIEDCHRRFRDDQLVEELILLLEQHLGKPDDG